MISFRRSADHYEDLFANSTGVRGIILPGPAGGKQGMICGVILIDSDNPEKYLSVQKEIMNSPVLNAAIDSDISMVVTKSPAGAVTIKDIKLDKVHIDYKLREETPDTPLKPQSKQAFEMIHKIYGEEGLTMYMGIAGKPRDQHSRFGSGDAGDRGGCGGG